jgi:hypothetical protein
MFVFFFCFFYVARHVSVCVCALLLAAFSFHSPSKFTATMDLPIDIHAAKQKRAALEAQLLAPSLSEGQQMAIRYQIGGIEAQIASLYAAMKVPDTRGVFERSLAPLRSEPFLIGYPAVYTMWYGTTWLYMQCRHDIRPYTEDQRIFREKYLQIKCGDLHWCPPMVKAAGAWTAFMLVATRVGNRCQNYTG